MKNNTQSNVVNFKKSGLHNVGLKFEAKQSIGPLDQAYLYQDLNQRIRDHVSAAELSLLFYIAGRSVGYGKPTFRACVANIIDGAEGFAGLGMSKPTYHRAVKSLVSKGLITSKSCRDSVIIGFNFEWKSDMLPVPKRLKGGQESQNDTPRSLNMTFLKSHIETQSYNSNNLNSKNTSPVGSDGFELDFEGEGSEEKKEEEVQISSDFQNSNSSQVQPVASEPHASEKVSNLLGEFQADLSKKTKAKITKAKSKSKFQLKAADLELIWKTAMVETFPEQGHAPWTVKDKQKIAGFLKRKAASGVSDLPDFVEWSITNWRYVLRRNSWMKNAPQFPSANWWMSAGIQEKFREAQGSFEEQRFENRDHQDEFTRLKRTGLTDEDANRVLAERKANADLHNKMAKNTADANRQRNIAETKLGEAKRLDKVQEKILAMPDSDPIKKFATTDGDGNLRLPHPQSPVMVKARQEAAKAKAEAAKKNDPTPSNPAPAVPTESWEELQERQRLARQK